MRYMSKMLAALFLGLVLAGCEPNEVVDENSAGFEAWLRENGLAPLDEAQATELFSDRTLYGRYGGAEGRWIEFYSKGGVSVFQPDAEQNPKRRLVLFRNLVGRGGPHLFFLSGEKTGLLPGLSRQRRRSTLSAQKPAPTTRPGRWLWRPRKSRRATRKIIPSSRIKRPRALARRARPPQYPASNQPPPDIKDPCPPNTARQLGLSPAG